MGQRLLQDRVAVVTGAGQGIGREIARVLTEHGARVVLADVNETAAKEAAAGMDGVGVACDVTSDLSSYVTGSVIEVDGGRYM